MTVAVQQFDIENIQAYFKNTENVSMTGLSPDIAIKRQVDGLFFNSIVFVTALTKLKMTEVDSVNCPGFYEFSFDTTGLMDANYTITASGTGASNHTQTNELKVGGFYDDIGKSQGGSSVIHLEGVFTKKEKEKLIALIADSISDLTIIVNGLSTDILTISDRINNVEAKLDHNNITEKIDEMQKYLELQTQLIEQVGEENTMIGELHG